ncbi:MAG: sigma factor [Myxococcota bacterium]
MTAEAISEPLSLEVPSRRRAEPTPSAPPRFDAAERALARYLDGGRKQADFPSLHEELSPSVHIGCARALQALRGGRRSQLPDLAQEVWIHLLAHEARVLHLFDANKGSLRSFITRVAQRRARDLLRRVPVGDADVEVTECSRVDELEALRHEARDALDKLAEELDAELTARARPIFHAFFVQGANPGEVSDQVGVTRAYVHKCTAAVRRFARAWRERNMRDGS